MKITRVVVSGVKGRGFTIDVSKRNLLLGGSMGAGKSAVLTAIRLALLLPTEFGSTNLDRLSQNGSWSVQLWFDDGQWIQRVCDGGKHIYSVNGINRPLDSYSKTIKSIIDVEPHQIDLGVFLGLSGQKRAELFSSMLELGTHSLVSIIKSIDGEGGEREKRGSPLSLCGEPHFFELHKDLFQEWENVSGKPSELVDFMKTKSNDAAKELRDAKTSLDSLIQKQQAPMAHGLNPAEAKEKVREIDERIGAIKSRKSNFEHAKEQYEAADELAKKAEMAADMADAGLVAAKEAREKLPQAEMEFDKANEAVKAAESRVESITESLESLKGSLREMESVRGRAIQAKNLITDLLSMEWEIDDGWLVEEFATLSSDLNLRPVAYTEETHKRLIAFAREVVTEAMGGEPKIIDGHIREIDESIRECKKDIDKSNQSLESVKSTLSSEIETRGNKKSALDALKKSSDSVADNEVRVKEKRAEALEMRQKAQRLSPRDDIHQIDTEILTLKSERDHVQKRLTDLEDRKAIAGQVEEQKVEVLEREEKVKLVSIILKELQRWRDEQVEESMRAVIGPFQETFKAVFGDSSEIGFEISGSGRSTKFDFKIRRPQAESKIDAEVENAPDGLHISCSYQKVDIIPFDLLSDGEMVLVGLSFLATLQKMKDTPGSLITMNTEPLDMNGFLRLLRVVPALGIDCVVLANNASELYFNAGHKCGDDWDYVNLSERAGS